MAESLITQHIDLWTSAIEAKSTAGRGSKNKFDLYGIKKLRELILELAVRGKLVPQDPTDEPASVLLRKIAAEKSQLIKEKAIKKIAENSSIPEEEQPFELPDGWQWSRLEFLTKTITKGSSPKWQGVSYTENTSDVLFITSENVGAFRLLLDNRKYVERKFNEIEPRSILSNGDFLMNIVGASIGRTAIYDLDELANINQAVCLIRMFAENLCSLFFLQFFNSNICTGYMFDKQVDNARANLSMGNIARFIIPIPPLAEQFRIVSKVNELMALCDQLEQQTLTSIDAHATLVETLLETLTNSADAAELEQNWARISEHFDTLFTTEQSIDALKQTILQLAVMGKLVRQDPTDEPASVLLEKIAAEKVQLIKDKKIKKEKPLPPISDDEKPFELPPGWEWCRLNDFTLSSEAGWSPQCDSNPRIGENWGVLKVSAVTWGKFKSEENKALPQELNPKAQYEIESGDFLISRANTADLVAKSVVVPIDAPNHLMMSDKIIRFKFSDRINAEYINLVNNSLFARNYYALVAGGTSSSMKNVSRDQIRNLVIALPSKKEASLILEKYNELLNICEKIKLNLQICNQTNLRITDAIVDNALN